MIHIVFCSSAAGALRQMLRKRGSRDKVVDLTESLDWGPITISLKEREYWLNQHAPMGHGNRDWIGKQVAVLGKEVETDPDRLIWIAPNSAAEQAGLFWFLSQFGGIEAEMIVADYPLSAAWKNQAPFGLGELHEDLMAELFDGCPRAARDETRFPRNRWLELKAEDSLLRVVENGALTSVSETFFDDLLLAHCPATGTNWRRVAGYTMAASFPTYRSLGDDFLFWRLRELIHQGRIACDGELKLLSIGDMAANVRRLS